MPYLNLDVDYFSHRKTLRLTGLLGAGSESLPIRLWVYVAKHHPEDGRLVGYSPAEIGAAIGWLGDVALMLEALLNVGFLEKRESAHKNGNGNPEIFYQVHGWREHAGHLIAFKKRAKTAAKKRWPKYASSIAKSKAKQCPSKEVGTVGLVGKKNGESPRGEAAPPVADDRVLIGGVPYRWPSPEGFVALSLDPETWNSFVDYRRTIREPLTPHAEKLAGKKLAELRALGQDAKAVIEQSILNHWSGLFPVKNGRGGETKSDALRKKTQEILKRGLE